MGEKICSLLYQFFRKYFVLWGFILFAVVIVHIFLNQPFSGFIGVLLIFSWLGFLFGLNLDSRLAMASGLLLLLLVSFLLIFNLNLAAERAAVWSFILLALGGGRLFLELKRERWATEFEELVSLLEKELRMVAQLFYRGKVGEACKLLFSGCREEIISFREDLKRLVKEIDGLTNGRLKPLLAPVLIIIHLGKWVIKHLFEITAIFFLCLSILKFIEEIKFYSSFFEEYFWQNFCHRIGVQLVVFWLVLAIVDFWLLKVSKRKSLIAALILLVVLIGNKQLYAKSRAKFEFEPYVLRIFPDIADNWQEVNIYGRNFSEKPFIGRVEINGKEQTVNDWNDRQVIIIIDPVRSETGNLCLVNQYQDHWTRSNCLPFTYYEAGRATPEEEKRFWEYLKRRAKE